MPLTLTLRSELTIPVEVDALQWKSLRTQSAEEVARTLIQQGNQQLPCGEFFSVAGSAADDETVVIDGDCRKVKRIGAGWTGGKVRVTGSAGMHLGAELRSGEIIVEGDVDDCAGAELRGGRIHVKGNAGNRLGAAYHGSRKGMRGGEILVEGTAGHDVGFAMRRGLIAIGGSAGDALGANLIAGTILVLGNVGRYPGAGMKRGTVLVVEPSDAVRLLPTFREATRDQPSFLELYWRHLEQLGFPVPTDCRNREYQLFRGDAVELGLGEVYIAAAQQA